MHVSKHALRVDKLSLIKREYLTEKYLRQEIQHKYTELSIDIAVQYSGTINHIVKVLAFYHFFHANKIYSYIIRSM